MRKVSRAPAKESEVAPLGLVVGYQFSLVCVWFDS